MSAYQETKIHGTPGFPYIVYPGILPEHISGIPHHWHEEMEIIYVTEGTVQVSVRQSDHVLSNGDIVLVHPQTIHAIRQYGESSARYYNILFRFSLLENGAEDTCRKKYLAEKHKQELIRIKSKRKWRYLKAVTGIPVEHNIVERIKYDKSLVDIKMGMGISKAYYKDNVTAFILLSSDSDFWGVISSLPDADFLVMVEEEKCGSDIQNALEQDGTYYCFMDDFCTGNIKTFKNAMFVSALKDEMWKALAVDTHALIDDIIRNLRMDVSASEKSNFYNKYIRKMRLEIDDNGILKIKVQEE